MGHSSLGLIVTSYGRQFVVEVQGKNYQAVTKSKKTEYVVGDVVEVSLINNEQAQINSLIPRHNLVYRSDRNRSKIIASNIDQMLIVVAVKPNCNINFLNNCLIFAHSENITPLIIINKTDLAESVEFINSISSLYKEKLGYTVIQLSALSSCIELSGLLHNKRSLLIGQSGVGKSTITNAVVPHANTRTGVITKSENSGRHTTTNAELYHIDASSILIDCPGLQEFGLYHLEAENIINYFPELTHLSGHCRFRNCRHLNEPDCAVIQLFNSGGMDGLRFNLLQSITRNLLNKTNY